jgi:phosphoribosylanthranilate isomerase
MVRLKICGITNWPDAKLCVDAGADLLGFNFYRPSPRYIAPEEAWSIIRRLPRRVEAVGLFVNASYASILRTARAADLTMIQLHGDENPRLVATIAEVYPVIKAFRVRGRLLESELKRFAHADCLLLDGFHPELRGGTGAPFDWRFARDASRYGRIILAGGLTPGNLAAALRQTKPYGIDVCSGVESAPGKKDAAKVKAFARAAGR